VRLRGHPDERQWRFRPRARLGRKRLRPPHLCDHLGRRHRGRRHRRWADELPTWEPEGQEIATRKASGAWKAALEGTHRPTGLSLTRQPVPVLEGTRIDGAAKGGCVAVARASLAKTTRASLAKTKSGKKS
jgi:transketolase